MYSRFELEEALKREAKNQIFEREFQNAVTRNLREKRQTADTRLYKDTASKESLDQLKVAERRLHYPVFTVEGDDELQSKRWDLFFKDAAFYFDKPTIQ
eukprot:CAMPEP_0202980004 /NCGR_PEP_ID=MMETSP1396-20130829/86003_1 /ASSEMBLY_ACC=CAM_ASM_000872 /TAXON_ID= /ORGANISM="Pseudokeronopsis sp., Strain Brazil" /LENGTH=98 /DNA_ID=CAMNT_0049719695 /DNA_START=1 /DNA_END=297 /DNA_ORIENTATION=+